MLESSHLFHSLLHCYLSDMLVNKVKSSMVYRFRKFFMKSSMRKMFIRNSFFDTFNLHRPFHFFLQAITLTMVWALGWWNVPCVFVNMCPCIWLYRAKRSDENCFPLLLSQLLIASPFFVGRSMSRGYWATVLVIPGFHSIQAHYRRLWTFGVSPIHSPVPTCAAWTPTFLSFPYTNYFGYFELCC